MEKSAHSLSAYIEFLNWPSIALSFFFKVFIQYLQHVAIFFLNQDIFYLKD